MKKTAIITRVEINKSNELMAFTVDGKSDGWAVHEKANLGEKAAFVKTLNAEIKDGALDFESFGMMFDQWNDELDEKYGFAESNEEEGEDEEQDGMHINAEYKSKYAEFNQSCGDDLANAMHDEITIQVPKLNKEGKKIGTKDACDMASMKRIAKANGLGTRMDGWMHLNIGHIRMVLRNSLFAMINHGHKVVVGKKTWKEDKKLQAEMADKKKKQAKKFADLKKKSKDNKEKKDNKVKKNKKAKAA